MTPGDLSQGQRGDESHLEDRILNTMRMLVPWMSATHNGPWVDHPFFGAPKLLITESKLSGLDASILRLWASQCLENLVWCSCVLRPPLGPTFPGFRHFHKEVTGVLLDCPLSPSSPLFTFSPLFKATFIFPSCLPVPPRNLDVRTE